MVTGCRSPTPVYGGNMEIDEAKRAALNRLTDNERECLRRRLRHQTAKEMAIDLGVSPHAVEKRLKMARTKLGLSSSLEAARLLETVERDGPTVPQPADLAFANPATQAMRRDPQRASNRRWIVLSLVAGASAMFVLAMTALLSPLSIAGGTPPAAGRVQRAAFRPAPPDEVRAFVQSTFRTMDRDRSGFIEQNEAPDRTGIGRPHAHGQRAADDRLTWIAGRQAQTMWIARADADGDGRVSETEYMTATYPVFADRGVPVDWRPNGVVGR